MVVPAELRQVADRARPVTLARERTLPLVESLRPLLPDGVLARGTSVAVEGAGATTLALSLAAGPSRAGSWVVVVGLAELGLAAAAEAGVDLRRLALVDPPGTARWAPVVAALVGGVDVIVVDARGPLTATEGRRLAARVRERGSVMVPVMSGALSGRHRGAWPADVTLTVTAGRWEGLGAGHGHLRHRRVQVEAGGRGQASRPRRAELWLPGALSSSGANVAAPTTTFERAEETASLDGHDSTVVELRGGGRDGRREAGGMSAPETVVRTLVVACADWPVVAAGTRPDVPAAVVRANRVTATSPAARLDGVEVGHRRREAQGRCPRLTVLETDPGRDARSFEAVAAVLERFTPRIELSRPGLAAFPTRGPSRYFGGDEALAAEVSVAVDEVLGGLGWPGAAGVGVADGAFAAHRAAESAPVRVVERGGSATHLAPLPVAVLGRPELADVLVRLGLRTLGAFAALAAADVVARFGADGRIAHRLARGLDERPPATAPPPRHLEVVAELDPPAERVDVAAFVAKGLADELHLRLDRDGLACTRVCILAETEHGERSERVWRHEGALSAGALADRVRWQLDGWLNGPAVARPTSGVTRLTLTPDEVVAATGRQLGFWGGETASDERAARALARVQGLLGTDAVAVPELRGGRGPGERVVRVPAATVELAGERAPGPGATAPWPGRVPAPTPALVPAEPHPIEVRAADGTVLGVSGRGHLTGAPARVGSERGPELEVVAWAGPWPADERWWDAEGHRRRARLQLQLADGRAVLVHVEEGRWSVEGYYD